MSIILYLIYTDSFLDFYRKWYRKSNQRIVKKEANRTSVVRSVHAN